MSDIPSTPKTDEPDRCKVCLKPLPETDEQEHGANMYLRPKYTCSNRCYNLDWIRSQPVGAGWMPIVWDLHNKLTKTYPDYRIQQIKEKFGGLRFYVDGVPLYTEEATKRAQEKLAAAKENREPEPWAEIASERREEDYTDGHRWISEAESRSYEVCEWCGEDTDVDTNEGGGFWSLTLCEGCHVKRKKDREERAAEWARQKKEREDGST